MHDEYDFSGWATKNDVRCGDGVIIRRDAFKDNDGKSVPLVWNHQHNNPEDILGHALLENRDDGVYAYASLNNTDNAQLVKEFVQHGDIDSFSIWANDLTKRGSEVLHGRIREVSVVLSGANPEAHIESVLAHGEDGDSEDSLCYNLCIPFDNSEDESEIEHAAKKDDDDDSNKDDETEKKKSSEKDDDEETIADVFDTMTEKQQNAAYAMIAMALGESQGKEDEDKDKTEIKHGGESDMKHNVFDREDQEEENVLKHSDLNAALEMAKTGSGKLSTALKEYIEDKTDTLAHDGVLDDIEPLFPEYKDVRPGAPELIERDQGWVGAVMQKVHKSPISRIRTRQIDIRDEDIRAYGYMKGTKKEIAPNGKLLSRTTDPQTVYRKDRLERDDIIDITDFDVVEYQYGIMKQNLNEELARAIMIGDGREDGDSERIYPEHIRDIWHDDELYTMHYDVDIAAAKEELQGTNTSANFGENYIYAEAIITAALYSREKYKGKGTPDFFCTPHLLNVMLLARDLNGRRIYDSKSDLAAALNVNEIYTAEQFEGLTRVDANGDTKKLLGIFVNLGENYQVGSTKGGEITRFNQFDIDFNQEKYLIETRLSGALTRVFSAIALEELETEDETTSENP